LFQFYFPGNKLQGTAIDARVLMMWKNYFDGVPYVINDNTNILSEGIGDASLRLRRRFMRTSYVPRDVLVSTPNVSSELNVSIRVLNFRHNDNDITERIVSYTTDEDNSSFTDDLNNSGPLTYIPSLVIMDEEDGKIEEYP
jgi:hypothetical protein